MVKSLAQVRAARGGHEVILRYEELGLRKSYVSRPREIDVLVAARQAGDAAVAKRIPLLLREGDVIHLDYGRCVVAGMGDRVLGVATQTLGIEREGQRLLTLGLGSAVSASLQPTYDADGFVRVTLTFPLAAVYFGRTGYRIRLRS